ncbi:hypothetical protein, partial [Klebsiella pneumoniae]|uniref:hypothetical protein n=1 Tax=Klebsiella pneumoniae TaxID=573 RepID=UPI0023AFC8E3
LWISFEKPVFWQYLSLKKAANTLGTYHAKVAVVASPPFQRAFHLYALRLPMEVLSPASKTRKSLCEKEILRFII